MIQTIRDFWAQDEGIFQAVVLGLLVCALFWLFSSFIYRLLFPFIEKRTDQQKHPVFSQLITGFRRPLAAYLKLAGVCTMLSLLATWLQNDPIPPFLNHILQALAPLLTPVLRIASVVAIAWGLIASSDVSTLLLRSARHRLDIHMSKSVSRFLSAVFNVIVVAVAAVIILKEMRYDINGLIAGLGLGGLTIALAAKDSASNFFGGLVLITEKPFEIGDWVEADKVQGTVEDINLRSTKIRTSDGSLTVVPNASLAGTPITNWSGPMEKRRANFILALVYGTPKAKIRELISEVQTLLETDPEVITDSIIVRFLGFGESALNIRVIYYTTLPGYSDHIRINERINFAIMDLAERLQIDFAFPSRSVYLQTGRDVPAAASPQPFDDNA